MNYRCPYNLVERYVMKDRFLGGDACSAIKRSVLAVVMAFAQCKYDCRVRFLPLIGTVNVMVCFVDRYGITRNIVISSAVSPAMEYDRVCTAIGLR